MSEEVRQRLELDRRGSGRRRLIWGAVLLAVAASGAGLWWHWREKPVEYRTTPAETVDLMVTVTATGTLEPLTQVDVGSEVSGRIAEVSVDHNDRVKPGDVLARIDPEQLRADLDRAEANLAVARAGINQAKATLEDSEAKLKRAKELRKREYLSAQSLEEAIAQEARAAADLASARARVTVAAAERDSAASRLEDSVIRSPIGGVVISRDIEPGQTVAASFQTPKLFTIAQDLAQMELHVDVDEADVGKVSEGQQASFKVDAYPDRTFEATIAKLQYAPQTVNDVVTYTATLAVDNADLALRPGMTALAEILVAEVPGALVVPNDALKFAPKEKDAEAQPPAPLEEGWERVWVLDGDAPRPVPVKPGLSDGKVTEVLDGEIAAGAPVITGTKSALDAMEQGGGNGGGGSNPHAA